MTSEPLAAGGLYEFGIGTRDLDADGAYWEAYGYRAGPEAFYTAEQAKLLYGVDSALTSRRLLHQDADHGLIRLMQWENPTSEGVGVAPFRGNGSRWAGQFARDILDIANHAEVAKKQGQPVYAIDPSFIDMSSYNPALFGGNPPTPFKDTLIGIREYTLILPHARQAFLQRFHYDSAMLGKINDDCMFPASQLVHGALFFKSDVPDILNFYTEVLGLKITLEKEVDWQAAMASRKAFDLTEDETHWNTTFEEPRSGETQDTRRSGRLLCFRFPTSSEMVEMWDDASPGALGMSLYTWRVTDIDAAHKKAEAAGATDMTDIQPDEFGDKSFSFRAPDGYFWTFVQAPHDWNRS